jgi:hypothetical protein
MAGLSAQIDRWIAEDHTVLPTMASVVLGGVVLRFAAGAYQRHINSVTNEGVPPADVFFKYATAESGAVQAAATMDGKYGQSCITQQELQKLLRSDEFKTYYEDHGDRLREQNREQDVRAKASSAKWFAAFALLVTLIVPFNNFAAAAAKKTNASAVLWTLVGAPRRVDALVAGTKLVNLFTVDAGALALPAVLYAAFLLSMARATVNAHLVSVASFVTLVWLLDAIHAGFGLYTLTAFLIAKVLII